MVVATRAGKATDEIVRLLAADGFLVVRAETGAQVVDALADPPPGADPGAALLIIGSTLYRDLSGQIDARLRARSGAVPVVIQLDDAIPEVPIVRRAALTIVVAAVAPTELVAIATSMLSKGLLDALCQTDQRAWEMASQGRQTDDRRPEDP